LCKLLAIGASQCSELLSTVLYITKIITLYFYDALSMASWFAWLMYMMFRLIFHGSSKFLNRL